MKKTKPQKPAAQKLYNDQAVNDLVSLLTQFSDPDQVLMEAGLSRADLRRLESDDEISAAMETRVNAVLSTPWRLEPGDGAVYDFVMPQLHEHLEGIINAAWKAVPYGYSVIEAIYRKDSDAIRWDRLEERPFEWFRPTIDGKLRYYPKAGSTAGLQGQQVDTTFKFYLARRRPTYRNPMGEALLSRLYWPWFFRANGWKFWARFLERFGSPLLIGKTEGSTQDMATALAQAVQSAVAAVGSGDAVDVVAPSGSGDSFRLFSDAVDRRIQKVVLGQTLTTDVGSKGSFAAAKVHNEVRDDRRLADVHDFRSRTTHDRRAGLPELSRRGAAEICNGGRYRPATRQGRARRKAGAGEGHQIYRGLPASRLRLRARRFRYTARPAGRERRSGQRAKRKGIDAPRGKP